MKRWSSIEISSLKKNTIPYGRTLNACRLQASLRGIRFSPFRKKIKKEELELILGHVVPSGMGLKKAKNILSRHRKMHPSESAKRTFWKNEGSIKKGEEK